MSTQKFEQLIDLIINEDQEKAQQLFHSIVVEKSREIYESLMEEDVEDLIDEIEIEETDDTTFESEDFEDEEEVDGDYEIEDSSDEEDEMSDEEDEMSDEEESEEVEMDAEDVATKDDIMDLEDKLDQIMAAFEEEFGSEEESDEEETEETEEETEEDAVMEAVELKKVSGLYDSKIGGDDGDQKRSPVAANGGAKGPVGSVVKPVMSKGDESVPTSPRGPSNAYTKGGKMTGEDYQNSPSGAKGTKSGSGVAAIKPVTKDEAGKSKSPIAESKKVTKKRV